MAHSGPAWIVVAAAALAAIVVAVIYLRSARSVDDLDYERHFRSENRDD